MLARRYPPDLVRKEGYGRKTYVKVVELELLEGLVKSSLDVLGLVVVVPQLRGDPDVLTLEAGDLGEGLLDTLGNLGLVLVDLGEIEVAVAGLEGLVDTNGDFAGSGLPGAVSQSARMAKESVESVYFPFCSLGGREMRQSASARAGYRDRQGNGWRGNYLDVRDLGAGVELSLASERHFCWICTRIDLEEWKKKSVSYRENHQQKGRLNERASRWPPFKQVRGSNTQLHHRLSG